MDDINGDATLAILSNEELLKLAPISAFQFLS